MMKLFIFMFLHKMKDHWLYKIIDVIDFKYKNMHTLVTHDGTVIIRSKSWNWNDEKNYKILEDPIHTKICRWKPWTRTL